MVDSWVNVRFQGLPPHPVVADAMFRTSESGDTQDWPSIVAAAWEVRLTASQFLDSYPRPDPDLSIHYEGSTEWLRPLVCSYGTHY